MKQEDHAPTQLRKPLMVYDGDCGFCGKWIARWKGMTGDLVAYLPSSKAGRMFPDIPAREFERAVQLIRPDGSRCSGAEAVLEVTASCNRLAAAIYAGNRRSRILRALSEAAYRFVAGHRSLFSFLTKKF